MQQNPYQAVAQQCIELWQKQLSSVTGDKAFLHCLLDSLRAMQNAYATAPAPQPATAADAESDELAQLRFRLAACERRLAQLEAERSDTGRAKPQRKAG